MHPFDEQLLSSVLPLDPLIVARVIADRLVALGLADAELRKAQATLPLAPAAGRAAAPVRPLYFCSGCPHNRSTKVPEGSMSMTGIGCHTMVNLFRPDIALLPTHMGGEGGNWIGLSPFTNTSHIFQNLGDGTYYHSGLLAIRAAVASKANITYKILYNDAVAMTGGQPVDGPISVGEIAHQVRAEGVKRIVVLSDDPTWHRASDMPEGVSIGHRDRLDEVQRELRETPGCTVLIYEQTCAAEKRRRRKRGNFPDPAQRMFISKAVCEGCGDCSVQSTCVSLVPLETEFGRKRAIDQSSCNKDYSCLNGFCPSFVTVRNAGPRKPVGLEVDSVRLSGLPIPAVAPIGANGFGIMIAGIGGTGVVTVGAILGMAAHLEGRSMSLFDMTGLSQKNGAVFSHVRIACRPSDITTQRLGKGSPDLLLAFNLRALRLGRLFVEDPAYVQGLAGTIAKLPETAPASLDEIIRHRAAHLEAYQNAALADRYRRLVEHVAVTEARVKPGDAGLAIAVARNYAKLLSYKDEYEVARLLSSAELQADLQAAFADGGHIRFNLAPPFMPGKRVDGRPRKREFGSWILPLFRIMARMRRLRGTVFDPFGRTAERKMERRLIVDYEGLVDRLCRSLNERNHGEAVKLAALADGIRGFGPVKDKAVEQYHEALATAEDAFMKSTRNETGGHRPTADRMMTYRVPEGKAA